MPGHTHAVLLDNEYAVNAFNGCYVFQGRIHILDRSDPIGGLGCRCIGQGRVPGNDRGQTALSQAAGVSHVTG